MALRYFIKYFDVVDIEHRFNIYDDDFSGDSEQIDGKVMLDYSETDNPLEAIRGQGLSVELEADQNLTFNDLWSEEEKTFQCEYKRDGVILFQGWLNPEGFFENWVNTNWIVTFDCVDGLGYLKDLAFIEDATGLPITGRKTYLELLSLALIRTGLALKINTNVDIYYTGLSDSLDVLDNVYANTERYIKDDGETIMSCDEVIRDILEPYAAVLTSLGGEWYIYKPNQLYANSEATFFNYTYLGVPSITPTKVIETSIFIGSNWKGATLHHCSGNQQIRNKASLGAYRINYKYGLSTDLLDNRYLFSTDGIVIDNWSIAQPSFVSLPGAGKRGATLTATTSTAPQLHILASDPIDVVENIKLDIRIKYISNMFSVIGSSNSDFTVQLQGTTNTYQLEENGEWVITGGVGLNYSMFPFHETSILLTSNPVPEDGIIIVFAQRPFVETGTATIFLSLFSIVNITESPSNLKGEFHTVQREDKPSSKVDDIKEVATGDNPSDVYEGTIYKTDEITPTETWNRKGVVESKPILQIMGEETMRMSQLPARVFSGDVFGYFNYLSTVTIDGVDGIFEPIKYRYDTKANVIAAEFRQMYANELTDIDYEKTFDYGNTVKPTIIG
jgi:hypothetical protein